MNPPCARCDKTVYPVEKLYCLDKIWHKGCFSCETCGVILDMKNYKGYGKNPYCSTHYPSTKFTAVADTPENKRLAKETKQQSSVVYHKEFDQDRNNFTTVESSDEALRQMKVQQQASDLAYSRDMTRPSPSSRKPAECQLSAVPPQPPAHPSQVLPPPAPATSGARYVAVYDYNAADDDEVSFQEGDVITDVSVIDDGWANGRVERTGEHGLIPYNYISKN